MSHRIILATAFIQQEGITSMEQQEKYPDYNPTVGMNRSVQIVHGHGEHTYLHTCPNIYPHMNTYVERKDMFIFHFVSVLLSTFKKW